MNGEIDFAVWRINVGALRYFGILTFEDRPDILILGERAADASKGQFDTPAAGATLGAERMANQGSRS